MSETNKIDLYRQRDMGQVIAVASLLFRRHWKHMFRTIGLMTLPLFLMTSTLYFLLGNSMNETAGNMIKAEIPTLNLLLTMLAGYISFTVLTWGCVYYVQLYEEKGPENFEMSDIWNKVFSHGWQLLLVYILYLIIFAVVSTLLILSFVTLILIPISLVALMFVYALFFFLPIVFLLEKNGIFTAINRGIWLLKKNWLKACGILLCTFAVIMGVVFTPVFFSGILAQTIDGYGFEIAEFVSNPWFVIVMQNVSLVLSFVTSFFLIISFTALYYSLVESKNKYSLKKRIEALSEATEPGTYS